MDDLTALRANGLFLRREAIERGLTDRGLRRYVRQGDLFRVRQGAYVPAPEWKDMDPAAQHLVRARAVLLTHEGRAALSHVSGAIAHGMRVWGADLSRVHLVRLDGQSGRSTHDVVHHFQGWSLDDVASLDDLTVLSPAQCAVGVASCNAVESGVVTIDSAYDLGLVTRSEMREVVGRLHRWPGTAKLQVTMRLAQPGAQSVGESRLRYLCWRGHLPRPELQFEVRDSSGNLVGIADMAWPENQVLGEFDGQVKYGRFLRPGEDAGDAVFREKKREDRMREVTGWPMIRVTWSDLGSPEATLGRLRRVLFRS